MYLPNNGVDTYYGKAGLHANPPASETRANWSFDFAWNLGTNCQGCTVQLMVDKDPTAGITLVDLFATNAAFDALKSLPAYADSWNMEMNFMTGLVYDFNPFAPSSTAFELVVRDAAGLQIVDSDITVNVPEPGTVALVGLALAGLGFSRRNKIAK